MLNRQTQVKEKSGLVHRIKEHRFDDQPAGIEDKNFVVDSEEKPVYDTSTKRNEYDLKLLREEYSTDQYKD